MTIVTTTSHRCYQKFNAKGPYCRFRALCLCFLFSLIFLIKDCRAQQEFSIGEDQSLSCPNSAPEPNSKCEIEDNIQCFWGEECCMLGVNGTVDIDSCSAGSEISEQCGPEFECSCSDGTWLCKYTEFCMWNCDILNEQQQEYEEEKDGEIEDSICPTEPPEVGTPCTLTEEESSSRVATCSWGEECCMKTDNGDCSKPLIRKCAAMQECTCYEGYWECMYTDFCYLDGYVFCDGERGGERFEMTNCFSSHTTTTVEGKGIVPMSELVVGDRVLTGTGQYENVYAIDHRHLTKPTTFLQIHYGYYGNGNNNNNNSLIATAASSSLKPTPIFSSLEVTARHMIFLEDDHQKNNNRKNRFPVPAESIRVGDKLLSGIAATPIVVTRIDRIVRNGLVNPLTKDGTIAVTNGGIIASTYSAYGLQKSNDDGINDNASWVTIQGQKIIAYQSLMSQLSKPYQFVCSNIATTNNNHISLSLCHPTTEEGKTGISQIIGNIYEYFYYLRYTTNSRSLPYRDIIIFAIDIQASMLLSFLVGGIALLTYCCSWFFFVAVLITIYINKQLRCQ